MNKSFSLFLKDAQSKGSLKYTENSPLSSVSTAGTGGAARFFVTPFTETALISTVKAAFECGIYYTVIGNASNVLFSDEGHGGAVISTKRLNTVSLRDGLIYAECGAGLPALSKFAAESSLTGFEGLVSIPGTVGGALVSNAGAFGSEISDRLISFSVYLPERDILETRTPKLFPFSYRKSHATDKNAVILSAIFSACKGDKNGILEKMRKNTEKRRLSQPTGEKSVGSFFKRPDYLTVNGSVSPLYLGKSAGELIDLCGLKGEAEGGVSVSKKHAGFLVNLENGTTEDFLRLSGKIKQTVLEKTGVLLTEECVILPKYPLEYKT